MKPSTAALTAGALLALASCSPVYGEAYLTAFATGERAYHDGRYVEARPVGRGVRSRPLEKVSQLVHSRGQ